jgi:membrane associated rhomboid family serine protease
MLGASGAVAGVMMATALFFPNSEIIIFPLPIPVKMKYFVLFYAAYEIISGINPAAKGNIAHFAHLGGMLFAFILLWAWGKRRPGF